MKGGNYIFHLLTLFIAGTLSSCQSPFAEKTPQVLSKAPIVESRQHEIDDNPSTTKSITFIHTGDFHGDLFPHANLRADNNGLLEGGLARVYSVVQSIRQKHASTFHVHTGDTISGGAEATFTRGQVMIDVVNIFGIDVFTPGNWEFAYGIDRFLEFFKPINPKAPWNTIAANVYYTGGEPYVTRAVGENLIPPYRIEIVGGLKLGMFGCTTNRGPTIVSDDITKGVEFSACRGVTLNPGTATEKVIEAEIPYYVNKLRNEEKVDLVLLLSEAGLAENIYNAQHYDGIDIIFSSDMHEVTRIPVLVTTPNGGRTLIIEEGEDGAQVGELSVEVNNASISNWSWIAHKVDESVVANSAVEKYIKTLTKDFYSENFIPGKYVNPYNGAKLMQPLDTVIGMTEIALDRNRYSNEKNPALIEGTGHDFLADAFRAMTGAQIGAIRGFRYTNTIPPGLIRLKDLYHYIPIGPMVAVGEIKGAQLNGQIENAANSCMDPDITNWRGGWLFNFSGLTFDIDPFKTLEAKPISAGRAFNLMLDTDNNGQGDVPVADSDTGTYYTYASYFYLNSATTVNRIDIDKEKQDGIRVLVRNATNELELVPASEVTPDNVVDATEVVVRYIATLPQRTITAANTPFPRIKIASDIPLPDTTAILGFPVIEPVFGMDPTKY